MKLSVLTRALLVGIAFLILAIASTWPLITNPAGITPIGPANNDPHFNIYLIFWGAHALVSDPLNIHHTNMFYPERYTFAYSDIELSHSLLMLPVIYLFYEPFLAYNLLLLMAIVIGGVGFFLLARDLTGSDGAAFLGAAIYMFNPSHFGRFLQIQFFGDFWLPWAAWALLRWLKGGGWGFALSASLFFCLQALSGSHNAVFGALLGAGMIVYYFFVLKLWRRKGFWSGTALMALVVLLVAGPVLYPYMLVEGKISRQRVADINTLSQNSAGPHELLSSGSGLHRWIDEVLHWPSGMFGRGPRGYLFPGFAAIALAVFGFFTHSRCGETRKAKSGFLAWLLDALALIAAAGTVVLALGGSDMLFIGISPVPAPPAWLLAATALFTIALRLSFFRSPDHILVAASRFCVAKIRAGADQLFWLAILLFFFILSLGPAGGVYLLIGQLPLVRAIRVPGRFILIAVFALAVLAAYGGAALSRRFGGGVKAKLAVGLVAAVFAAESLFAPLAIRPVPEAPELYSWLATQDGKFTVVEFPLDPRNYTASCRQVFHSIYHWKYLLVGYSGYQSQENVERLTRLNDTFPTDNCLDELEDLSVRYLVVFRDRLRREDSRTGGAKLEALEGQDRLERVAVFGEQGELEVYALKPSSGE